MAAKGLIDTVLRAHNDAIDRWAPNASTEVFDVPPYPWAVELEAQTEVIVGELERLITFSRWLPLYRQISSRPDEDVYDGAWSTFFFRVFGQPVDSAAMICPKTAAIIEAFPEVDTAMFSILAPDVHIRPHVGPSKGELRYHLPLIIPSEDPEVCGMRIGGHRTGWKVGRSLVFDDTCEHEAWNRSDEVRVVLFLGTRRPVPRALSPFTNLVAGAAGRFHPDVAEILDNANAFNQRLLDGALGVASMVSESSDVTTGLTANAPTAGDLAGNDNEMGHV